MCVCVSTLLCLNCCVVRDILVPLVSGSGDRPHSASMFSFNSFSMPSFIHYTHSVLISIPLLSAYLSWRCIGAHHDGCCIAHGFQGTANVLGTFSRSRARLERVRRSGLPCGAVGQRGAMVRVDSHHFVVATRRSFALKSVWYVCSFVIDADMMGGKEGGREEEDEEEGKKGG